MSITKMTADVENISTLSDYPNSTDGLTSTQLKAKFDKAGSDIKTYLNDTLTDEIDEAIEDIQEDLETNYATKEDLEEIIAGQIPDGTLSKSKLNTTLQRTIDNVDLIEKYNELGSATLVKSGSSYINTWTIDEIPELPELGQALKVRTPSNNAYQDGTHYFTYDGWKIVGSTTILNAFDDDTTTSATVTDDSVVIELPSATELTSVSTYITGATSVTWKGSADKTTWYDLLVVASDDTELTEHTFLTSGEYKYYKAVIVGTATIYEIEVDDIPQGSDWYIGDGTGMIAGSVCKINGFETDEPLEVTTSYEMYYDGAKWQRIENGIIAYNKAIIQINESALANKTITATNTSDATDVYTATFDSNGKCLIETGVGTYNLLKVITTTTTETREGLEYIVTVTDTYSATLTTLAGKKNTATLSKTTTRTEVMGNIILGFDIDESESDPEDRVTYTENMADLITAGKTAEWVFSNVPMLSNIKPCRLNTSGTVTAYLNPDDFTKDVDGNTQTLTNGDNVMIEFPKIYWYVTKEGTTVHCKIANYKVNNNYKALAHTRGTTEQDKIYIGAYLGYSNSNVLKSWSGMTPTSNATSATFRTYAQANGTNYQKMTFYMYTMLQLLFVLRYKSTDCQTALGKGFTNSSNSAVKTTGGTEAKGMNWGETAGTDHVKFLGIEDVWGNLYQFIDGLYSDSSWNAITTTGSFADFSGDNAVTTSTGLSANTNGYITNVVGTTEAPFLIKVDSGSATTHYCDYGHLDSSRLPIVGGYWADDSAAGLFSVDVSSSSSAATAYFGSRVCYL